MDHEEVSHEEQVPEDAKADLPGSRTFEVELYNRQTRLEKRRETGL